MWRTHHNIRSISEENSQFFKLHEKDNEFLQNASKKSIIPESKTNSTLNADTTLTNPGSTPNTTTVADRITPNEMQGIWQAYGPMRAAKITSSGQIDAAQINAAGQIEAARIRGRWAFITSGALGFGLYVLQSLASYQRKEADDERRRADQATEKAGKERKKAENERKKADQAIIDLNHKNIKLDEREKKQEAREEFVTDFYSTYISLIEKFEVANTMAEKSCNENEKCLQDYNNKLKDAEMRGIRKSKSELALFQKQEAVDNSSPISYQVPKSGI